MAGGEELGGYDIGEEMKGILGPVGGDDGQDLLVVESWVGAPKREALHCFRHGLS